MSTELQPIVDGETVARVILHGDLSKLTPTQKVNYFRAVCESCGLNPLTKPFEFITLNGREVLYALKGATDQLRQVHKVAITIAAREVVEDTYVVTARATLPDGRTDESIGAVPLGGLKGESRANALMKAETKAKRRVTLSIIGLGMLDETEVESIPFAAPRVAARSATRSVPAAATGGDRGNPPAYTEPVTDQVTPPADDLPAGFVRVMHINTGPTKNPSVPKYFITFSNGEEVTTINSWLASLAEEYRDNATPVRVKTRQTKYGTDLMALMTGPEGEPPEPPPTDAEIPF